MNTLTFYSGLGNANIAYRSIGGKGFIVNSRCPLWLWLSIVANVGVCGNSLNLWDFWCIISNNLRSLKEQERVQG